MKMKMKIKLISLLLVVAFCFMVAGCGEVKRPLDRPNSKWSCKEVEISFSVSSDGKITNGVFVDKNQNEIPVSVVFGADDKVSITNVDETETYISGVAIFEKDYFAINVKDIYNPDFEISGTRLYFYPSK